MNKIDLAPTEVQNLAEQMLLNSGSSQLFVEQSKRILELDPDNQLALRFLLHKSLRLDGYGKSVADFEKRIQGRTITEPTELYLDINRLVINDSWQNRQKMRRWQAKYPRSEFLECIGLLYSRLPEDITSRDIYLMNRAITHPRSGDIIWLQAYHELSLGNSETASRLFQTAPKTSRNIEQLALIDSLTRQGLTAEANTKFKQRADLAPQNANPTEVWEMIFINLMLGNLDEMKAYALAYQKLRPEKAQGFLMEWLILEMQYEPIQKIKEQTEDFMKSSSRYSVAGQLLAEGKMPDEESLTNISDQNVRLDTALFFILLDLDSGRNPIPLLKTAQLSSYPTTFAYAFFNHLRFYFSRSDTLPKTRLKR